MICFFFCPVESIELLLQIIVEETRSAFASGAEEDTAAWVRDYVYTPTHANRKALINMLLYNRCIVLFSSCYKGLTLCFFQVEPYLQRTPGFSRLLGVWSR